MGLLHAGIAGSHAAPAGLATSYYSMAAPAGWWVVPDQPVSHQTLVAPDQNADIEVFVVPSPDLGPNALRQRLQRIFGANATVMTSPAPRFSATTVQGVHVQEVLTLVRWRTGMVGIVEVAAAFYQHQAYVVEGEIVNARSATVSQDAAQIDAALNTFSFR
jgi:hypothetical protein